MKKETESSTEAASLMDEKAVAELLNISLQTLRNWRWKREGPRFTKLGRLVRYRRADIEAFIEAGAAQ